MSFSVSMLRFRSFSLAIIFLFIAGCGKDLPELEGIDKAEWVKDRNGCLNLRRGMADAIRKEKEKLLALDELEVVALLGKPDHNELYRRNQKFYLYFILPAPECAGATDTITQKLVVRFNAMGLAKEVLVE